LTLEHSATLDKFFKSSTDFANVFTTIGLNDFRAVKEKKIDNIVHIVSYVSQIFFIFIFLGHKSYAWNCNLNKSY